MKRGAFFSLAAIFIFFIMCVCGRTELYDENQIPPGMEMKKIDRLNIIVPEGTKIFEKSPGKGGAIFIETTSEYMARQLVDIEEHFAKIEKNIGKLKEEVEILKEAVEELK